MSISLRLIHLYTKNLEDMSHFLSTLFDVDILHHENGTLIECDGVSFLLHDKASKKSFIESLVIELEVKDQMELKSLSQKIEFLNYRHDKDKKITFLMKGHQLEIVDLDSRKWFVSSIS